MLRGLTTVSFYATDVAAARDWYADILGAEAYYSVPGPDGRPAYVEFRVGDFQHELGIIDARFAPHEHGVAGSGAVTYWHVDDVDAAVERLCARGATVHEKQTERGPGFVTASVLDPFGNILGVMFNQHYLDIVAETRGAAPA